ncbi:alanine--tRNA ligase [bacterium]|nr:alanine--tRNA ligase [bacterium]
MKGIQIRKEFFDFFEKRKHKIYPSSSLIPENDPSLLFTSAGMVPFKDMFLGKTKPEFLKVASLQRCFRTSDIEKVGYTNRHHTFFEMFGNFSFGNYFKEEAISWAWEFLTRKMGLEETNLYASVYKEDNESYSIWRKFLPEERIVRLGKDSNFWQMAETGPCGPCSEILIDRGKEYGCGKSDCAPGCDCDRYLEIWNLVFTQFEKNKDGILKPLPKKNIDTGMGLERLSAVVQNVPTVFESDVLKPIMDEACKLIGVSYNKNKRNDVSLRIIVDHIRGIVFLINDGILPSNEERGYVLRRILRRAAKEGKLLGAKQSFLYKLTDKVVEVMGSFYPVLVSKRDYIREICKMEEERFKETLDVGYEMINSLIVDLKKKGITTIPGKEVFKLHDTYGFPLDLTKEIAREKEFDIDEKEFKSQMQKQQKIASKSWKGSDKEEKKLYSKIYEKAEETVFRGYSFNKLLAKINMIVDQNNKIIDEIQKGDIVQIVLSETPFYGESGGQVGDRGKILKEIKAENAKEIVAEIEVLDTTKLLGKLIVHKSKVLRGKFKKGDTIDAFINPERRKAIMRSHTATHLLQAALRQIVGKHVKQSGSLVDCDRLRFDFTHFSALSPEQIKKTEELVNKTIRRNLAVLTSEITMGEAKQMQAMAHFGEKYGEKVRVVMISAEGLDAPEDAVSIELCAGTHCHAIGELGLFKIINETSIAAGVRRIEALTGAAAYQFIREKEENLLSIVNILKVPSDMLNVQVEKIVKRNEHLKKELSRMKGEIFNFKALDLIKNKVKKISGINVLSYKMEAEDSKELRNYGDKLKHELKKGIIVLGSIIDDKPFLICVVTDSEVKKGLHAGKIIKKLTTIVDGAGVGKADLAQGGGKNKEKLEEALKQVEIIIKEIVKK